MADSISAGSRGARLSQSTPAARESRRAAYSSGAIVGADALVCAGNAGGASRGESSTTDADRGRLGIGACRSMRCEGAFALRDDDRSYGIANEVGDRARLAHEP